MEAFRQNKLTELGISENLRFVQDNHSRSGRGVVRGMHLQIGDGIDKLVWCARGAIMDVVVDVRRGSPTYGKWQVFDLSEAQPPPARLLRRERRR
jgi:dTDP-4-dehydrorhamnose 3,5-epimerase